MHRLASPLRPLCAPFAPPLHPLLCIPSQVKTLATTAAVDELAAKGEEAVVVVYAPWCQFCQAMEEEVEKLAADGVAVYKFRGDEEREYVGANMNTASFPTVNKLSGGKFVKYDSEDRSVEALKAFATSKVSA